VHVGWFMIGCMLHILGAFAVLVPASPLKVKKNCTNIGCETKKIHFMLKFEHV